MVSGVAFFEPENAASSAFKTEKTEFSVKIPFGEATKHGPHFQKIYFRSRAALDRAPPQVFSISKAASFQRESFSVSRFSSNLFRFSNHCGASRIRDFLLSRNLRWRISDVYAHFYVIVSDYRNLSLRSQESSYL